VGIPEDAVEPDRVRYHRYAQAIVDHQLGELATRLQARSQALYLDFPLGTHRFGYDVWDQPGLFVDDARVGAPPDQFFSEGQDWGFPPVHPEASRADGHAYFAASIEHHLAHAGLLRIDHVIGLHRMWWIPPCHDATDGAFVRYPTDELYARLCLASVRRHAGLIGENLGTVPPEVNRELRRHRIGGMHIVQFELDRDAPGGVRVPAAGALTSLDTHDTATFAGFWSDAALDRQVELGLSTQEEAEHERAERTKLRERVIAALRDAGLLADGEDEPDTRAVMTALLELVGSSKAQIVLVSLEDLWLEPHAQNVPGTVAPENWRRPAALALDEVAAAPELVDVLRRLASTRATRKHRSA
jgi:4-alpha-glucanotransferase